MTSERLIEEIKNRDFFANIDHFHDFDNVQTKLVLGKQGNEEVFLTIIIPVYDHPLDFIIRAISSALSQEDAGITYKVLIIDDYAYQDKDNGVEGYLQNHLDKRILYYKNERNMGVFGNWNRGIQLANSKWVTLLHSDDFYKPNYLKNMINVLKNHPEIDQLACKYEILDYTNDFIDEKSAMMPASGQTTLRKVDYREYTYEMFTSVKGSIYKKDTLIKIGGFRSQDVALGLDDYPLMMRYAYYYNTYYLDAVLYIDSWGYNDSLNIKHWYPQLIADYYMWKNIEKKRSSVISLIYSINDKKVLIRRAKAFAEGTSYIKKKIPIDFEELYKVCNIKSEHISKASSFICRAGVKLDQLYIKRRQAKMDIYLL